MSTPAATHPERAPDAHCASAPKGTASPHPRAPFVHPVRIYWEDTDAGGVVFYANYLKFFERARTEWLRSLAIEQQALRERSGAIFIVSDTALRFLAPARLDDLLRVSVQVDEVRPATLRLTQQAWCQDRLLCEGTIRIGCVDSASFRPRRIPTEIIQCL